MSRFATLLVIALLAISPVATQAAIIEFTAFIDGNQEVPPVPSNAKGVGVFELDTDTNEFSYEILYTEVLLAGDETVSHIHGPAAAGFEAPPIINLPAGEYKSGLVDLDTIAGANVADLLAGLWYVNIHSTVFPDGEIRGQIIPIPEPSTLVLAALGLVTAGFALRRRKAR